MITVVLIVSANLRWRAFQKILREEMKPHGIKVTALYPGAALTDSWAGSKIDPKRIMEASDIAEMIYACTQLSPQACPGRHHHQASIGRFINCIQPETSDRQ